MVASANFTFTLIISHDKVGAGRQKGARSLYQIDFAEWRGTLVVQFSCMLQPDRRSWSPFSRRFASTWSYWFIVLPAQRWLWYDNGRSASQVSLTIASSNSVHAGMSRHVPARPWPSLSDAAVCGLFIAIHCRANAPSRRYWSSHCCQR